MRVSIEEFMRVHPDASLAVRRVLRGPSDARVKVWMADLAAGYFTSDTDRLCGSSPSLNDCAFGDSPEEAIGALVGKRIEQFKNGFKFYEEASLKARTELEHYLSMIETIK